MSSFLPFPSLPVPSLLALKVDVVVFVLVVLSLTLLPNVLSSIVAVIVVVACDAQTI
jgi:hypothetical protein